MRRDAPWIVAPTPLQTNGIADRSRAPPTAFFARPFAAGATREARDVLHVRALREVELFLNERPFPLEPADAAEVETRAHARPPAAWLAAGEERDRRARAEPGRAARAAALDRGSSRARRDRRALARRVGGRPASPTPSLAEDSFAIPRPDRAPVAAAFARATRAARSRSSPRPARRSSSRCGAAPARGAACTGRGARAASARPSIASLRHVLRSRPRWASTRAAHRAYVDWIAAHRALPHPRDGSIMYHPPLYHAASALLLGVLRPIGAREHAILLLLPLACGFGMAWVAAATLRALAPGAPWLEAGAALAAGLLPMNLILASSVSNEGPSAFLASLALLVAVRALRPRARFAPRTTHVSA